MPVDTSIYGTIQGPQKLDLNSLIEMARNAQRLQGESAIGDIYQQSTNADGTIDAGKLGMLAPRAGVLAPQVATHAQQLTQGMQAIEHQKMENMRLWQHTLANATGDLIDDTEQDPTRFRRKVLDRIVDMLGHPHNELNGMPLTAQMSVKASLSFYGPNGDAPPISQQKQILRQFQNQALDVIQRGEPMGDFVVQPGQNVPGADGKPLPPGTHYQVRRGGFYTHGGPGPVAPRPSAAVGPAGLPTSMTPGEADVMAASAGRASQLQATAGTTAQYHADLENLKQDSRILDNLGGPTAEVEKKLNQLTQRLGGFGVTMDRDQLRAAESFDKIANQISLNQSKMFHGSDAGLHTVLGANPSLSMSRYGRDGVIDMLQGNQDAIDVTRKAWMDARARGAPAHAYDQFVHEASKVIDPRVFQFNRLTRENQQKFWAQLDPGDEAAFKMRYQEAVRRGWVKPPKAQ